MSYYQNNLHRIQTLKKFLEPELRSLKKKSLNTISDILSIHVSANNKKDKHIQLIINKFCEILNSCRKVGGSQDTEIEVFVNKLPSQDDIFPNHFRRALSSYMEYFKNQGVQMAQLYPPGKRMGTTVEDIKESRKCICLADHIPKASTVCSTCLNIFHADCLRAPANELFECPFCFIKNMDPLHQVVEVLFMGYLKAEQNIHNLRFSIKESDINQAHIQLEIRSIRLDGKNNYELTWPDFGYCKINEAKLADFKPLINNSSLKRRKDESKPIEKKILRINSDNFVQFTVLPPQSKEQLRIQAANHFIGIFTIRSHLPQNIVTKISQNMITEEQSRKILLAQMTPVDDILIEKVIVSMKCVLSMLPIKIPARARQCTHFNCFDLEMYLNAVGRSQPRRWRCPICKKKAHHLVVDPLLSRIIWENSPKIINQICFLPDLTFTVSQEVPNEDESQSDTPEPPQPKNAVGSVIQIDDEEEGQNKKSEKQVSNQEPRSMVLEPTQFPAPQEYRPQQSYQIFLKSKPGQLQLPPEHADQYAMDPMNPLSMMSMMPRMPNTYVKGMQPEINSMFERQQPMYPMMEPDMPKDYRMGRSMVTRSEIYNEEPKSIKPFPPHVIQPNSQEKKSVGDPYPKRKPSQMPLPFDIMTQPHEGMMQHPSMYGYPQGYMRPPMPRYQPPMKNGYFPPYNYPYFGYPRMGQPHIPPAMSQHLMSLRREDQQYYMKMMEYALLHQQPYMPYPPPNQYGQMPTQPNTQPPAPMQPPPIRPPQPYVQPKFSNHLAKPAGYQTQPTPTQQIKQQMPPQKPVEVKQPPPVTRPPVAKTQVPPTKVAPKQPNVETSQSSMPPLRPQRVIEIMDSDQETEEQRCKRKNQEQVKKLTQINFKGLDAGVIITKSEQYDLLQIIQRYERQYQPNPIKMAV